MLTAVARGGEARLKVIASHGRKDISGAVGSMVVEARAWATDSLPAYGFLGTAKRSVKHSAKEFARTDPDGSRVHVNTAESVHADLRRMVLGVHHWISRRHLDRYLEDLAFRRSLRDLDLLARLRLAMTAPGRLAYSDLVAR